jgi:dipeptidyl aminopeptidase/acylaminoacyl peptidase
MNHPEIRMLIRRSMIALLGFAAALGAQPTTSDIYLARLTVQNGRVTVGAPINITNRPGYDNQPSFTPDSRAVLYTSTREDAQSDIYRYDLTAKTINRVTNTPESEYSATVMPDGARFSVIRVERDSAQRLWSFALDGSDPKLVIESLKPVGYHAWLDANTLAMFVLGSPNALVFGDLRTKKLDTLARGIGRSLAKLPNAPGFSFTQTVDSAARVRTLAALGATPVDVVSLPRRVQDLAWLSNGSVLVGSGSKLLSWQPGASAFSEVVDLASAGITDITRLAVSPDGQWLAFVAVPRP